MYCLRVSLPPVQGTAERQNFMILFRSRHEFRRRTLTEHDLAMWILGAMPAQYRKWYNLRPLCAWCEDWLVRVLWLGVREAREIALPAAGVMTVHGVSGSAAWRYGRGWRHEADMRVLADRLWNDVLWVTERGREDVPLPGEEVVVDFSGVFEKDRWV